jgi:tRNA threonylcarbamoyladenosine biosynthesis protein TsaB
MNTLALDTASDTLHLALETERGYVSETRVVGRHFSEELVVRMKHLCASSGLALADLDLIVCTNGPGSFTGLRVGMAAAKGVSLAASVPIVSISTMEIMSYPLASVERPVLAVMDAKKQRFYGALFSQGTRLTCDRDMTITELCTSIADFPSVVITGSDAKRVAALMSDEVTQLGISTKISVDALDYRDYGESMIQLGKKLLTSRGPDDLSSGPTYIRKSDAEVSLQEREQKLVPKEV